MQEVSFSARDIWKDRCRSGDMDGEHVVCAVLDEEGILAVGGCG